MSEDLVAFIRARLDEDEAAAKAASSGHPYEGARDGRWQTVGARNVRYANGAGERIHVVDVTGGPGLWYEQIHVTGDPDNAVAEHIARHDPARVLREVEALRAIVDLHELMDDPADYDDGAAPCLCEELWPCATIKALAGIWRDHPDYDPEWKP